jgi:putative membrane protein insertion efficiency factor
MEASAMLKIFHAARALVKRVVLWSIRFYQRRISPWTPPSCRFLPTCSHYTYEAIERFGLLKGGWLAVTRLCRCHPLCKGGYDPVPQQWGTAPEPDAEEQKTAAPKDTEASGKY